jgi:D-alanine-D-alanine ligase
MRVLIFHSDVAADAPPDEQDTLVTAQAIAAALGELGHAAILAPFHPDLPAIVARVREEKPDAIFNMVESVSGLGSLAATAPAMFERLTVPFTGCSSASMALTGDKPLTKRIVHAAGLPTPLWAEPPQWENLASDLSYIVKSATEDASIGLDDDAVVSGSEAVRTRARRSAELHGGRWFAEAYVEGREFNVAVLEENGAPRVLPMAEMRFEDWPSDRPRIVGYAAKWDEGSADSVNTVRAFGIEQREPALARALSAVACEAWRLLGMQGFARIDFRVDAVGTPMILEANANPCLEPQAGFAAAASEAGMSYAELIAHILRSAHIG